MTLFLEESYSSVVHYTLYNLSNLAISTRKILTTEQAYEIPVSQKLRPNNQDLRSFFLRFKEGLKIQGEWILTVSFGDSEVVFMQSCFSRLGGGLRSWFLDFETPCEIRKTKHYS